MVLSCAQAYFNFCEENHYQFNTYKLACHASMMTIYALENERRKRRKSTSDEVNGNPGHTENQPTQGGLRNTDYHNSPLAVAHPQPSMPVRTQCPSCGRQAVQPVKAAHVPCHS